MPMIVIFRSRNIFKRIQYIVIEAAFYNICYYSHIWRLSWFSLGLNWLRIGSSIEILWPWCFEKQYEIKKFSISAILYTMNFVIDWITYPVFKRDCIASLHIISLYFEPNRILIFVIILYIFKLWTLFLMPISFIKCRSY